MIFFVLLAFVCCFSSHIQAKQYTDSNVAAAVSCVNPGLSVDKHLSSVSNTEGITLRENGKIDLPFPSLNDPKWLSFFTGSGHSWAQIGSRCLLTPEAPDCAPTADKLCI